MDLKGKIAVVTGASQGIGRAYVLALAQAGATVVASSRAMGAAAPGGSAPPSSLAETLQIAKAAGYDVEAVVCDVADEDQVRQLADYIIGNYGRIDIVVNNAATYPGGLAAFQSDALAISTAEWERYWRVNFLGPYLMISRLAPYMIAQGSGHIVNLTSAASLGSKRGSGDHEGLLPYGATKAAVNRLSAYFAEELRPHGIAVNALRPGLTVTVAWDGMPKEHREEYVRSGKAKYPTPEAVGPPLLHVVRQKGTTLTGQFLDADQFGVSWP